MAAQRLDKSGQQRRETQWDDDELTNQIHREIGGANYFFILAGQSGNAEN